MIDVLQNNILACGMYWTTDYSIKKLHGKLSRNYFCWDVMVWDAFFEANIDNYISFTNFEGEKMPR